MSYYDQCLRYVGRPVGIKTRNGRTHQGIITRVTPSHVYIRPMGNRNLGGHGYGWGWGFGGWGWPIALATIIALWPFFFW